MFLNQIKPNAGAKQAKRRVGRGIGSGLGKTCGLGHKGQKARAGGYHKVGFEGGQVPLQRRVPKFGFTSRSSLTSVEVRLSELNKISQDVIDIKALKMANIIAKNIKKVKIIASGEIKKAIKLRGMGVTQGAKKAIEASGGSID